MLSFQLCTKILAKDGKLNSDEIDFLLRGAVVLDRSTQPNNPDPDFIDQVMWDNINGADELEALQGLVSSVQQSTQEWKAFSWMNHQRQQVCLENGQTSWMICRKW